MRTCKQPGQPGIHLDCCPSCDHGDLQDAGYGTVPGAGARRVCDTFHLEHVHEGGYWHRHMFYNPHTHLLSVFFDVERRVLCPVCRRFECELVAHGRGRAA